jgi:hypothetical protein
VHSEILNQLGRPRVPPVPERVRLPLRAKDDFIEALRMCNLQSGLTSGVQALDAARRGGHTFDTPGEAVGACRFEWDVLTDLTEFFSPSHAGVLKDKAIARHTARKAKARMRVAAATAVVLEPPAAAQQRPAGSVSSEEEATSDAAMADADAALEAAEAAAEAAVAEEEAAAAAATQDDAQ